MWIVIKHPCLEILIWKLKCRNENFSSKIDKTVCCSIIKVESIITFWISTSIQQPFSIRSLMIGNIIILLFLLAIFFYFSPFFLLSVSKSLSPVKYVYVFEKFCFERGCFLRRFEDWYQMVEKFSFSKARWTKKDFIWRLIGDLVSIKLKFN